MATNSRRGTKSREQESNDDFRRGQFIYQTCEQKGKHLWVVQKYAPSVVDGLIGNKPPPNVGE